MNKQNKLRDLERVYRSKIEIWKSGKVSNELNESTHQAIKISSPWAEIVPQTGKLQKGQANTILTNVTHKITIRYAACNEVNPDMWIMHKGKRYDVKYAINPYFTNEKWEIFVEEVIE